MYRMRNWLWPSYEHLPRFIPLVFVLFFLKYVLSFVFIKMRFIVDWINCSMLLPLPMCEFLRLCICVCGVMFCLICYSSGTFFSPHNCVERDCITLSCLV